MTNSQFLCLIFKKTYRLNLFCLFTSAKHIALDTDTFSESAIPNIGILIRMSEFLIQKSEIPLFSEPAIRAVEELY